MCSELLRIPTHWGSVPIFGFGLALAVWAAVAGWALWTAAKQVGWPDALRAHLPTALVIAAAIAWGVPKMFPDGLPVRGYGVMVLAGSIAGILMAMHRARQANLPTDEILGFAVWLFLGGVIGARLFYVIEYWDARIKQPDPWSTLVEILKFTEGGLVIYGAFFGAAAGFFMFTQRRRIPRLAFADLLAPSLLAGLCLGRIGCFLNGCCYGGESTLPWSVTFPRSSAADTYTPPYMDQAVAGRFYGLRIATDSTDKPLAATRRSNEHERLEVARAQAVVPAAGAEAEREPMSPPVAIATIEPNSPAADAGLKPGDRIAAINGVAIDSLDAAHEQIFAPFRDGKSLVIATGDGATRTMGAIDQPPRSRPVHPAQLYSSIDAGLLAWLLWSYYPWRRREGEVTALMLTLHPVSRFLLEIIRVDEDAVFGTGLSISQNLSIGIFAVGVGLWLWLLRKPAGKLDFPLGEPEPA